MASEIPTPRSGGLGGVLRLTAVSAIVGIAAVALLVLFDVLPRQALSEWSTKLVLAAAILAAAAAGVAAVLRVGATPRS